MGTPAGALSLLVTKRGETVTAKREIATETATHTY